MCGYKRIVYYYRAMPRALGVYEIRTASATKTSGSFDRIKKFFAIGQLFNSIGICIITLAVDSSPKDRAVERERAE